MKYEAILAFSQEHSVRRICEALVLNERNYYRWKNYQKGRKAKEEEYQTQVKLVEQVFEASDRTFRSAKKSTPN